MEDIVSLLLSRDLPQEKRKLILENQTSVIRLWNDVNRGTNDAEYRKSFVKYTPSTHWTFEYCWTFVINGDYESLTSSVGPWFKDRFDACIYDLLEQIDECFYTNCFTKKIKTIEHVIRDGCKTCHHIK